MTTFLISLCHVIFGVLVASCSLILLYLLLKGLYLSIIKWYYKPHLSSFLTKRKVYQQSLDTSLECAPNKIIVLKGVSYKCIIQQHDLVDRCTQCSLGNLLEDCLSVNCTPEVEGEFKFYKLLKQ